MKKIIVLILAFLVPALGNELEDTLKFAYQNYQGTFTIETVVSSGDRFTEVLAKNQKGVEMNIYLAKTNSTTQKIWVGWIDGLGLLVAPLDKEGSWQASSSYFELLSVFSVSKARESLVYASRDGKVPFRAICASAEALNEISNLGVKISYTPPR